MGSGSRDGERGKREPGMVYEDLRIRGAAEGEGGRTGDLGRAGSTACFSVRATGWRSASDLVGNGFVEVDRDAEGLVSRLRGASFLPSSAAIPLLPPALVRCLAPCTSCPPSRVDTVLLRFLASPPFCVLPSNFTRDVEALGTGCSGKVVAFSTGASAGDQC